jgi:hypothetical protein
MGDRTGALPFADNLKWLFSWQIYQMYVRYFMWNFVPAGITMPTASMGGFRVAY